MSWQWALLLRIIIGDIATPIILKKLAVLSEITKRFFGMYLWIILLAFPCYMLLGDLKVINLSFLLIVLVGFFQSFGTYCYWRAVEIHLTKSSIYTIFDDLIAMAIGYIFLNEIQYLNNPALITGIMLSVGSSVMFVFIREKSSAGENQNFISKSALVFLGWTTGYNIFWGVGKSSLRIFALQDVSILNFVFAWYVGSFIGALALYCFVERRPPPIFKGTSGFLKIFPLAIVIILSLFLQYIASSMAPLTVVVPILQFAQMIFSCLIGLIIFKEGKKMTLFEKIALLIGLAGSMIITFSFRA